MVVTAAIPVNANVLQKRTNKYRWARWQLGNTVLFPGCPIQALASAHKKGLGDPIDTTGEVLAPNMTSHPSLVPVDQLMTSCSHSRKYGGGHAAGSSGLQKWRA